MEECDRLFMKPSVVHGLFYFHVEFLFKFFDKMVNKRDFLKIINLYKKKTAEMVVVR